MAFNPDAYLAKKASFDPDAYLSKPEIVGGEPVRASDNSEAGFFDTLKGKLLERGENISRIGRDETISGASRTLQRAGEVAGGILDVPMSALSVGMREASQLPIVGAPLRGLGELGKRAISGYMKAADVVPGVQRGNEAIRDFRTEHPEATANIGAVANITGLVPAGKIANVAGEAARFAGGRTLQAAGRAVQSAERGAARTASELTRISPDALEAGSTKAGREMLKKNFGQQYKIGQELVDEIDDVAFNKHIIEDAQTVREALNKMPDIDLENTIKSLQASKIKRANTDPLPWEAKANAQIDDIIKSLRRDRGKPTTTTSPILDAQGRPIVNETPAVKNTTATPSEFMNLRQSMDKQIKWDDETKEVVESALRNARETMRADLLNAAKKTGNADYEAAMIDLSNKLQARDNLLDVLGRNNRTRENRAEAFVKNLYGANKTQIQERVKELDRLLNTDYAERARAADLASEFGPESGGTPGLLPQHATGKSMLGLAAGGAGFGSGNPALMAAGGVLTGLSSPIVATRTLGGLNKTADILKRAGRAVDPDLTRGPISQTSELYAGALAKDFENAKGKFSALHDKKTRFEIDDSAARYIGKTNDADVSLGRVFDYVKNNKMQGPSNVVLSDIFEHPSLYKNYPELSDIEIREIPSSSVMKNGAYSSSDNVIYLNRGLSGEQVKKTIIHELQHAIQEKEGFARGGNTGVSAWASSEMRPALLRETAKTMKEIKPPSYELFWGKEKTPEGLKAYADFLKEWATKEYQAGLYRSAQEGAPARLYNKLAGEIEARDAASRTTLYPKQRPGEMPYSGEGIPLKDMVVLGVKKIGGR